ncbi:MAG: alpha/beta hydrolase [Prolixibacteraceae bacterium]|nr:alpha/beta hydrolase [Prolixibacteraceae bacterium]
MKRTIFLIIILAFLAIASGAQEIIKLYPEEIPNSKESETTMEVQSNGMYRNVTVPTLEIYLPEKDKSTGTAVVICPGGGYSVVVYQGEGVLTAKELAKNGIAAFVLKYRLPDETIMVDKTIGPLQDAQQAIKVVRDSADKWDVDPDKIGIMGFSAGGHLASTEATHYKKPLIENSSNTSLRPDFQILIYPVISMQDKLTHADSRKQLLGENPTKEEIDLFSNELQIDENSPPAYLTHAGNDNTVDVDNSIFYFEKLRDNKVPAELHIYQKGGHGFIFRHKGWMEPLLAWMKDSNWIN